MNVFDKLAKAFGEAPKVPKVTIGELVERKVSKVLYNGRLYKITVEELEK